jgi:hypothetical protein
MLHPVPTADAVRVQIPAPIPVGVPYRTVTPLLPVPRLVRPYTGHYPAPADVLAMVSMGIGHHTTFLSSDLLSALRLSSVGSAVRRLAHIVFCALRVIRATIRVIIIRFGIALICQNKLDMIFS